METRGKPGWFRVEPMYEQGEAGEGRAHVSFIEGDARALVIHFQQWTKGDGSLEWRNYGFTFEGQLRDTGERDSMSSEALQRVVDHYPYWLSLARTVVERPVENSRPNRLLSRGRGWKPAQPGRSPAFRAEIADEFVRRFDAGENAVTEIARAHGVTPGTVSKWLTKVDDPRVNERRASRYRRGKTA